MKSDINPSYYKKLAEIESSNNPTAVPTDDDGNIVGTAVGLYQFTKGTWNDVVKDLDLDYTLDDRNDPKKAKIVVEKFTEDNKKYLETRLDRTVTDGELYLAHFLGRKGSMDVLRSMDNNENLSLDTILHPQAIQNNPHRLTNPDGSPKRSFELYNWANNEFGVENNKKSINNDTILGANYSPEQQEQLILENEANGLDPKTVQKISNDNSPLNYALQSDALDLSFADDITALEDGGQVGSTNVTKFDTGGTHNETGGIPLGPNLVEEGEVQVGDYILSDNDDKNFLIDKKLIKEFTLDPKDEGKTFAEAGRKVLETVEDREFDTLSNKTAEDSLDRLTKANEMKRKKKKSNLYEEGGKLSSLLAGAAGGPVGIGLSAASILTPLLMDAFGVGDKKALKERNKGALGFNSQFHDGGTIGHIHNLRENLPLNFGEPKSNTVPIGGIEPGERILHNTMPGLRDVPGAGPNYFDSLFKGINLDSSFNNNNGFGNLNIPSINPLNLKDPNDYETSTGTTSTSPIIQRGTSNPSDTQPLYQPQFGVTDEFSDIQNFVPDNPSLLENKTPTTDALSNASDTEEGQGFDVGSVPFNEIMRFAPSLANVGKLLFGDNEPEVESLDRLDSKFDRKYVDLNSIDNVTRQSGANTRRAITANAGGSGNTAISGLLGSQLNESRGISGGRFKGLNINNQQDNLGDQFDAKIAGINLQQSNQEKQINAQNRAASKTQKDSLFQSIFGDAGNIGREGLLNEILKNTTGYGKTGKYVAEDGGTLVKLFDSLGNTRKKEISELIKDKYGS